MGKLIGIASFLVMFVIGAMNGAKIGSASKQSAAAGFDYATAAPAARQEWLDSIAKELGAEIDRSLPKGLATMAPRMDVREVRADGGRKKIDIDIQIKGRAQLVENESQIRAAAIEKLCPEYWKLPLGKNKIYVMQNFFFKDGTRAMSFGITPISCRKYM